MDLGYQAVGGGGADIRVYHQFGFVPGVGQTAEDAPLIDGPRGYCLDITNLTGRNVRLSVSIGGAEAIAATIGQGDPVITGPTSGRSRTAAQMAALGFTRRGDISLSIEG